jgi:hypothetical protein
VAVAITLISSLLSRPGHSPSAAGRSPSPERSPSPDRSPSPGRSSAPATLGPVSLAGVYSASQYGFDLPYYISVNGNTVWVANGDGNSVTELNQHQR